MPGAAGEHEGVRPHVELDGGSRRRGCAAARVSVKINRPLGMRRSAAMEGGPEFEVTRRATLDGIVVIPKGEIDLATVDDVRDAIDQARAATHLVILDLRATTFIDSAGVRL